MLDCKMVNQKKVSNDFIPIYLCTSNYVREVDTVVFILLAPFFLVQLRFALTHVSVGFVCGSSKMP